MSSEESMFDPQEKRTQFSWSWQAVRYRYRICSECNDEFKALLANASESWRMGVGDEELTYNIERSTYIFFMSALSVFDSFSFCLYFLGNAIRPAAFPEVANPRNITRDITSKALNAAFGEASITALLAELRTDPGFAAIYEVRNLLGHRLSGRRSVRTSSTVGQGLIETNWQEDIWYLPGSTRKLTFDTELLQRHLNDISRLLIALSIAARQFAETQKRAAAPA